MNKKMLVQKLTGLCIILGTMCVLALDTDVTFALFTIPLGLGLMFVNGNLADVDNFEWEKENDNGISR